MGRATGGEPWDRLLDESVVSLPDLLHLTRCADLDDLAALVNGDTDADVEVSETDDGVEVSTPGGAILLRYPFVLTDFWEVVTEVDEDEIRRWEEAEQQDRP